MRFVVKIFSNLADGRSKQPTDESPIPLTELQAQPNMVCKGWFPT